MEGTRAGARPADGGASRSGHPARARSNLHPTPQPSTNQEPTQIKHSFPLSHDPWSLNSSAPASLIDYRGRRHRPSSCRRPASEAFSRALSAEPAGALAPRHSYECLVHRSTGASQQQQGAARRSNPSLSDDVGLGPADDGRARQDRAPANATIQAARVALTRVPSLVPLAKERGRPRQAVKQRRVHGALY